MTTACEHQDAPITEQEARKLGYRQPAAAKDKWSWYRCRLCGVVGAKTVERIKFVRVPDAEKLSKPEREALAAWNAHAGSYPEDHDFSLFEYMQFMQARLRR